MEFGVETFEPGEVDLRQPLRCNLAAFDPSRKLCDRGECDVGLVCRQGRCRAGAADEGAGFMNAMLRVSFAN
jgi:hypothetical protein